MSAQGGDDQRPTSMDESLDGTSQSHPHQDNGGEGVAATKAIVRDFQFLLEKSQHLFAGLRDLPPTGKTWQPYFQRTFEVYTKLWKFQQQYRQVLQNPDVCGLKRWEIGEIASKIGQLYYHYYLRTSETNYLYESFIFYDAIRERDYFKDVFQTKDTALIIKKLRYFARFIVVCLLLNRSELIDRLMVELTELVDIYAVEFKPSDSGEWATVLSEISTFLEAERKLSPTDLEGKLLAVSGRLNSSAKSAASAEEGTSATSIAPLKLQEAILVGNYQNQIKFSELTLDMFRMLQSLEREPNSQLPAASDPVSMVKRSNPHKYLLYRPTIAQLLLYIATAHKDLTDNSALLIYLSADGSERLAQEGKVLEAGYAGGVTTATHFPKSSDVTVDTSTIQLIHGIYPADLVPFSRKPLFVIADSTNAKCFLDFVTPFPAPVCFLMGPTEYPASVRDTTEVGSLFTLFLHAPLKAFTFVSDLSSISAELWTKCTEHMVQTESLLLGLLRSSADLDPVLRRFMQDDFLAHFLVRFLFCDALFRCHNSFADAAHFPSVHPALPAGLNEQADIRAAIGQLADLAGVGNFYERAKAPTAA